MALYKKLRTVGLGVALLAVTMILTSDIPRRASACFYPTSYTTSYNGWYAEDGRVLCANPFGPSHPSVVVGQVFVACDGTSTSWGYTEPCFSSTTFPEPCDPICE